MNDFMNKMNYKRYELLWRRSEAYKRGRIKKHDKDENAIKSCNKDK